MIKIHKAGWRIITSITSILLTINLLVFYFLNLHWLPIIVLAISILLLLFVLRFFREPNRVPDADSTILIAPADGKVVVVEETHDDEILGAKCIQVSIFMSVWNVHINWIPVNGILKYFKYHPGKFLIAREPKSSTLNERTSLMIEMENGKKVVLRQIAGFVARRIETYTTETDAKVVRGQQMGFIKFGSRVDILLPLGTEILVKPGMTTKGCITPIAKV